MNEIYQSGLSGDRVMELLRRQFVVPTLLSAPTTNTLRWVDDMGYTNTFRVGELCRVAIDDGYTFYILKDLRDGVATWELMGSGGGEGDTELTPVYNLIKTKLDNSYFRRIFSPLDANGREIAPNDTTTPIASVRVNYGLWTEQFLSAKGMNSGGGSDEPTGGATTLGGLRNVVADADRTYDVAKMLVLEADSNLWSLKNLSELVGGLDEAELAEYLTNNNYAKKGDIPSLSGYATEQWVLGKGYATTSDLDNRIDALVNGAPQAYDTLKEIADVLANNINSIDDILTALGTKVSKDDFNTAIANVNNSISALNTELSGKIDLKLDAVTFTELFEKVQLEDGTWAIKAKLGLFSDGFISAKGSNVGGTSSEGGAVTLYQLNDVLADGTQVSGAKDGAVFVYDGKLGKWKGVAQSEIVPNLTGYAKESWVLSQGFLTQHQDLSDYAKLSDIPVIPTTDINKGVTAYGWGDHSKVGYLTTHQSLDGYVNEIATSGNGNAITSVTKSGKKITFTKGATYLTGITSKLVTDALGYTPYNAANFTKAKIKSTLGISDWALASSKPSYTTKEVAEDTNLYFTNARAVAALKSITDGLQSDIDTKLDASVFSELFEKVTLEGGVTAIRAKYGLFTDYFLSAKGANTNGGGSSGGGLITSLYRYADLGKTFSDTNNDTFNAYTINKINADLGSRISVLEGKATNVSFTQSLTSGTQIGSISIDGVAKNIYAPTIPTSDINKGVTAYGWGNHASVGYAMASALSAYQTKITSSNKLDYSLISGVPTKLSQFTNDLGLGTFAYKSSLAFADLTNKPTTISGYGITDAYTKSQVDSALGGYLPLSGGTITRSDRKHLLLKNTSDSGLVCLWLGGEFERFTKGVQMLYNGETGDFIIGSHNAYNNSSKGLAALRITSNNKIQVGDINFTDGYYYDIIHRGNIGSQSVASASNINNTSPILVSAIENDEIKGIVYPSVNTTEGLNNIYASIHNGLDFRWHNSHWLIANNRSSDSQSNGFGFWSSDSGNTYTMKAMISNDGIIYSSGGFSGELYGNAASATKLQTTRSIWGQSFDGTGNISGDIFVTQKNSNSVNSDSGVIRFNGVFDPSQKFVQGPSIRAISTGGYGIHRLAIFQHNSADYTTESEVFTIMPNGNVLIGTTTDSDGKLQVNGKIKLTDWDADGTAIRLENPNKRKALISTYAVGSNAYSFGQDGASFIISHNSYGSVFNIISGNVGIGTTSPQYKLDVRGVIYSNTGIFSDGYVSAKGQNTSSDMRLKRVLEEVTLSVKDIANAPSMRFAWKNGGGIDVGSSAQYWQVLLPDAVKERDGMLEMQYANIALLSAIAIAKNVETHEERIARLEKENKELRNEIMILKGGNYA